MASPLLRELAEATGAPCVSLYVPLEAGFEQGRRNATRFGHAVDAAMARLQDGATREDWRARLTSIDPNDFPLHDVRTLAIFLGPTLLRTAAVTLPLPERAAVGHGFVLRPLALALDFARAYQLLALSVNHVAFFEGDQRGLRPHPLAGLPASMADALGTELTENQLQVHPAATGGGEIVFHGHGAAKDERSLDLERFHRVVQRALTDALKASHVPLVLAADQSHQGSLRAGLHLHQLLPIGLTGSPDHLSAEELHARAWPLIEDVVARERRDAAEAFETARNHGKATDRLDETVRAAVVGRVRRLWVVAEAQAPGRIDAEAGRITVDGAGEDDDALEELAAIVLRHAGEVIVASEATPMPVNAEVAAQLRY